VIPGGIARLRAALVSGEPRCTRQTKVAACGRPSPGRQRRQGRGAVPGEGRPCGPRLLSCKADLAGDAGASPEASTAAGSVQLADPTAAG